jgi:DNA-binding transcriptional LysR family regulator
MWNSGTLRYFVAVAEERNISRAAARLHIAQPSLSQQLRELERELDVELVNRAARPLLLTSAGRRLLSDAYAVLDQVDRTVRAMRRAARGETGELRVGFIYGGLYNLLLPLLQRFRNRRPEAGLTFRQLAAADQFRALHGQEADVVLSRLTEPLTVEDIAVLPLRDEFLVAVLADSHPLARHDRVALADLAPEPFVLVPRRFEPLVFDRYLQACSAAGFTPRVDYEVLDAQTQALAVGAGLGVALTGDGLSLRFPGLRYVPVDPPVALTSIAALWHASNGEPLLQVFLELARELDADAAAYR